MFVISVTQAEFFSTEVGGLGVCEATP